MLKYTGATFQLMPFYVLKLGGSLIDKSREIVLRLASLTQEGYSFLVVPGGGPMADLVRGLYESHGLSDEAAHWMAILAMEQYAYMLADGTGAVLTRTIEKREGLNVLLPYSALLQDDQGIGHTWEFTSDSVAALAARRLDAGFIKATDVDGVILCGRVVKEVSATSLVGKKTCVDQGLLGLLKGRSCWVLNASDPGKFIRYIRTGTGDGTVIKG